MLKLLRQLIVFSFILIILIALTLYILTMALISSIIGGKSGPDSYKSTRIYGTNNYETFIKIAREEQKKIDGNFNGIPPLIGVAGEGDFIVIPPQYGTIETYEKEMLSGTKHPLRHNWGAWGNGKERLKSQGGLREDAIKYNRQIQGDIFELKNAAIIDNRLQIATAPNIGNIFAVEIGDYLDVVFEDGSVWNCILADTKAVDKDPRSNEWGHEEGQAIVEIIYWDYDHDPKNFAKKVNKIIKVGSYVSTEYP